jgi:hypothetical protein
VLAMFASTQAEAATLTVRVGLTLSESGTVSDASWNRPAVQ